jgi:L-fucose mutarotase
VLKNIDPILSPELLFTLRAMGHGDEIAIVDANYPADNAGARVIRADGLSATQLLDAILSLMPLDTFVPEAAWRPQLPKDPKKELPVHAEFQAIINKHESGTFKLHALAPAAFYERANSAYAMVASGERRLYGNVVLRMGVIHPE